MNGPTRPRRAIERLDEGPALTDTTARLRKQLDNHERFHASGGRAKRASFRPVPLSELAPTLKKRNEAAAQRDVESELRENAAREILIVCNLIRDSGDGDMAFEPEMIRNFAAAVTEMCTMLIEPPPRQGSILSDERRIAMRQAVDALMARVRPDGSP